VLDKIDLQFTNLVTFNAVSLFYTRSNYINDRNKIKPPFLMQGMFRSCVNLLDVHVFISLKDTASFIYLYIIRYLFIYNLAKYYMV